MRSQRTRERRTREEETTTTRFPTRILCQGDRSPGGAGGPGGQVGQVRQMGQVGQMERVNGEVVRAGGAGVECILGLLRW